MNEQFEIYHHGILGMRWGIRRYQNPDGTLTEEGKKRYLNEDRSVKEEVKRRYPNIENYAAFKSREDMRNSKKWKDIYKSGRFGNYKYQSEYVDDFSKVWEKNLLEGMRLPERKREKQVREMIAKYERETMADIKRQRRNIEESAKFIDAYLETGVLAKYPDGRVSAIDRNGNEIPAPHRNKKS